MSKENNEEYDLVFAAVGWFILYAPQSHAPLLSRRQRCGIISKLAISSPCLFLISLTSLDVNYKTGNADIKGAVPQIDNGAPG